jgi:hypothetical protein
LNLCFPRTTFVNFTKDEPERMFSQCVTVGADKQYDTDLIISKKHLKKIRRATAKSICKNNTVHGLGISHTAGDSCFYPQVIERVCDNALAETIRGTELRYDDLLFKQHNFFHIKGGPSRLLYFADKYDATQHGTEATKVDFIVKIHLFKDMSNTVRANYK